VTNSGKSAWRFLRGVAALALAGSHPVLAAPVAQAGVTLAEPRRTADLSPAALTEKLATFEEGRWIRDNGGPLRCGVRVTRYEYATKGGAGELATASSAVMVPTGSDPVCQSPHAMVVALHGTMWDRNFDLAEIMDPSNTAANRGLGWAALYAAQGYVVVAPNYVGFSNSSSPYHPYLDYDQQTRDVLDAIAAGRKVLARDDVALTGKLFATGFSQGGWLSMALHRKIEATGGKLTASMPSAGSYALTALVDDIFLGRPVQGSTVYFPLALTAAQRAGAGVYSDPAQFFNQRYARGVEELLPAPGAFSNLVSAGRVPATALFAGPSLPPPAKASRQLKALAARQGPDRGPEHLRPTNRLGIGTDALVLDSARQAYLADMAANPDGAWPVWRSGRLPWLPGIRCGAGSRRQTCAAGRRKLRL